LGIDPGVTTGVAYIYATETEVSLTAWDEVKGGLEGFIDYWRSGPHLNAVIVMEDFITREGKHGLDHTPERVIGAVRAMAERQGLQVIMRPPSGRLKQAPDWLLKALGVHLPGKANRNAREAVRHVIAHLKHEGNRTVLEAYRDRD
jgi:hypothetical protein